MPHPPSQLLASPALNCALTSLAFLLLHRSGGVGQAGVGLGTTPPPGGKARAAPSHRVPEHSQGARPTPFVQSRITTALSVALFIAPRAGLVSQFGMNGIVLARWAGGCGLGAGVAARQGHAAGAGEGGVGVGAWCGGSA